jgi:TPR repeat protein
MKLLVAIVLALTVTSVTAQSLGQLLIEAEQGDAQAQNSLGFRYLFGEGVPQNSQEAVKWYRLAAEQGNADAQLNLGTSYTKGEGVPQNPQEAVKWYRLAAEQGNADAQLNLGTSYSKGEGVPQNDSIAYVWYSVAAAQGGNDAAAARDSRRAKLSPAELEQAQALATKCFESKFKNCD